MLNNPKISVIIPVYNAEKYLNKCVDSVLNQTYKNFEIILIDDGSEDNSGEICDEYERIDSRVKVFHIDNGGPSRARNIGIEKSAGDIISFVDSDDCIDKNMAQKMVESIGSSDLIMCNYLSSNNGNNTYFNHNLGNKEFNKKEIVDIFYPAFYYSQISGLGSCCNKYYAKKFIVDNNIRFNESLIRAEDFWFNFDCFTAAKSIKSIDDYLYYYMQVNENSTMHQVRETQYEDWKFTRKRLLQKYNELNLKFDLDYDEFYKNFINNVSIYIIQRLKIDINDTKVSKILNDTFYRNSIKYKKYVSDKTKIMLVVTALNSKLAYYIYKLWSVLT